MSDFRIDALTTEVQQSILYVHSIRGIYSDANIIFFLDAGGNIVATIPVPDKIAYLPLGTIGALTDYRIDTLVVAAQQYEVYLHNVTNVLANSDVIFFIANEKIVATAPVASRIAYIEM